MNHTIKNILLIGLFTGISFTYSCRKKEDPKPSYELVRKLLPPTKDTIRTDSTPTKIKTPPDTTSKAKTIEE